MWCLCGCGRAHIGKPTKCCKYGFELRSRRTRRMVSTDNNDSRNGMRHQYVQDTTLRKVCLWVYDIRRESMLLQSLTFPKGRRSDEDGRAKTLAIILQNIRRWNELIYVEEIARATIGCFVLISKHLQRTHPTTRSREKHMAKFLALCETIDWMWSSVMEHDDSRKSARGC